MDDQLLFEQFHEAFEVEPRSGSFERLQSTLATVSVRGHARNPLALRLPRGWMRLAAVAALIVLAVASVGAFVAINSYVHRSVAVHPGPFKVRAPGTEVCNRTCQIVDAVFVSPSVGFVLEGTTILQVCSDTCPPQKAVIFRTRDAGVHWLPVYATMLDCCLQRQSQVIATPDGNEILFIAASISATALAFSSDGGATWEAHRLPAGAGRVSQTVCGPPYKGGQCVASPIAPQVYFVDQRHGWVITQEQSFSVADLFHTADAGAHWTLMTKIDLNREFGLSLSNGPMADGTRADATLYGQFVFRGNSQAWFLPFGSRAVVPLGSTSADSLTVFRSTDGGLNWKPQKIAFPSVVAASDQGIVAIKFFNDQQGILELVDNPRTGEPGCPPATCGGPIVERRFIYTTSDGGVTWSNPIPVPQPSNYASMRYIDFQHWVGWPYGGGWISTSDSGQHWQVIEGKVQFEEPPASGDGLPPQLPANYPLTDLYGFVDVSHGWALPYQGRDPNVRGVALFLTNDGGLSWQPASLPELG